MESERETKGTGQRGTAPLRWALAGTAVLLLAVIAGFVTAGRLRMKNYLKGLPQRLGVDIEQETNDFTYSQSKGHRKIFTVRAAKEVQHRGGAITLHDVGIVLYGPAGEPADRIHGAEFEYNQKAQTLTARGEVYIDLVPPQKQDAAKDAGTALRDAGQTSAESRTIHVKAIGLLFDQQQQTVVTDGPVEFEAGGYKGNAVGASYDAANGRIVLNSAVRISGMRAGRAATLTAARAQMDRLKNAEAGDAIELQQARYMASSSLQDGAQSFAAAHALVHTTEDWTPRRVDADGEVTLASAGRGKVSSDQMGMELGAHGQARAADFHGAVHFEGSDAAARRQHGLAEDAAVGFDESGRPTHALFSGPGGESRSVKFVEEGAGERHTVEAPTLEVNLAGGGKEPLVLRSAEARGPGTRLLLKDEAATSRTRSDTEVRADRLVAAFAPAAKKTELTRLDGTGHSWLQRTTYSADGAETAKDTSSGDVLRLDLKPDGTGKSTLVRGEQRGGFATVHETLQTSGPNKGKLSVEHGRADDAIFDAARSVLHLAGSAEVQDETSALLADSIDVNRTTGDATAVGSVKVAYTPEPADRAASSSEPVHVLAARAVAHKAAGEAQFFADEGPPVRLWQGTSQVEAPEVDFFRSKKRVIAKGGDAGQVKTVLAGIGSTETTPTRLAKIRGGSNGSPVKVLSREMTYTDATRTVEFSGGVRLFDSHGTMTANITTVWLMNGGASSAQGATQPGSGGLELLHGKVDHIVANGAVTLNQPGRKATGEKLLYTASDGLFVLTGTSANKPRVVDQALGTSTGAALRFHSGDDSVEVLGSDGTVAGRVRSETRVRQ